MSAAPLKRYELLLEMQQLHADYAAAVNGGRAEDLARWCELFTEDGVYKLIPRENHERGFPLATLAFKGQGMLKDRVYAIRETLFHDPYYQRHVIGPPRWLGSRPGDAGGAGIAGGAGAAAAQNAAGAAPPFEVHRFETNYAVFRTKLNGPSTVFNVGRYVDTVVQTPAGLRFAEKLAIYDSEMIPNSIIDPI
jgi:salicylate 5-hydroxylase small subunit